MSTFLSYFKFEHCFEYFFWVIVMLLLALFCTYCAPTPFLYTLHLSQVMLWGLKWAERLPCFYWRAYQDYQSSIVSFAATACSLFHKYDPEIALQSTHGVTSMCDRFSNTISIFLKQWSVWCSWEPLLRHQHFGLEPLQNVLDHNSSPNKALGTTHDCGLGALPLKFHTI